MPELTQTTHPITILPFPRQPMVARGFVGLPFCF